MDAVDHASESSQLRGGIYSPNPISCWQKTSRGWGGHLTTSVLLVYLAHRLPGCLWWEKASVLLFVTVPRVWGLLTFGWSTALTSELFVSIWTFWALVSEYMMLQCQISNQARCSLQWKITLSVLLAEILGLLKYRCIFINVKLQGSFWSMLILCSKIINIIFENRKIGI